jgi:hypothetical protein
MTGIRWALEARRGQDESNEPAAFYIRDTSPGVIMLRPTGGRGLPSSANLLIWRGKQIRTFVLEL